MLALLCKEVPGDLKAPRSHSFHDPSACVYRMKCALLVKISGLWTIICLPLWASGLGAECSPGLSALWLPTLPPCPRECTAPSARSARSGCTRQMESEAGKTSLRAPQAPRPWARPAPLATPREISLRSLCLGLKFSPPGPCQTADFLSPSSGGPCPVILESHRRCCGPLSLQLAFPPAPQPQPPQCWPRDPEGRRF